MSTGTADRHRRRLAELVGLLSDDECRELLRLVDDVTAGERFWEGDFGLLYNEYVKLRYFPFARSPAASAAAAERGGPFQPVPLAKVHQAAEVVPLPPPLPVPAPLGDVLPRRRSHRHYTSRDLPLEQLSSLLWHAAGVVGHVPGYGYDTLPLRPFPSHGGLQSTEIYLAAQRVAGLAAGVYHFDPSRHALELLGHDDGGQVHKAGFGERYVDEAAAVLVLTGVYDRLRWKYGERSYRFICLDAGFVGQNVSLVAEALGLGTCAVSGFAQDVVEAMLGVDGRSEMALVLLAVGMRSA